MECGREVAPIGRTKNAAANTDIPAAVRRSSAPSPRPMNAVTVRYNDAPATSRSTPGSVSELGEHDAEQADRYPARGGIGRRDLVRRPGARDRGPQADDQHDREKRAPPGRSQRPQFGPLRADHAELAHRS